MLLFCNYHTTYLNHLQIRVDQSYLLLDTDGDDGRASRYNDEDDDYDEDYYDEYQNDDDGHR